MRSALHTTSTTHRRRSVTLRALTAVALGVAVLVALVGPASGAPDQVAGAEARLAEATAAREQAEQRVRELRARHDELQEELQRLGDVDATLTAELADARRALREYAVAAYIDGGRSEVFRATLDIEQAQALAAEDTAARFQELKDANSPEQLEVAESLDRAARELQEAEYDAIQAAGFERDAESAVATARAEAAQAALDRVAAEQDAARDAAANRAASSSSSSSPPSAGSSSSPSPAPAPVAPAPVAAPGPQSPAGRGDPSPAERETLARIRWCESRNNYSIVSASGRYRGAYQFDVATWQGVGGSGDPAAASPAEQDYRALLLLRMRGTRPWPHCGR